MLNGRLRLSAATYRQSHIHRVVAEPKIKACSGYLFCKDGSIFFSIEIGFKLDSATDLGDEFRA
jgi:hypothetical protein